MQSKYKEDTSTTNPMLLDEPELKVHSFPSHAFSLPHVAICFLSSYFLHVYLFLLPTLTSTFLLSLLLFSFRLIPSPFLFITLRIGKFLLLWACPWRASLMRQILWLRLWPLHLLLHIELLSSNSSTQACFC